MYWSWVKFPIKEINKRFPSVEQSLTPLHFIPLNSTSIRFLDVLEAVGDAPVCGLNCNDSVTRKALEHMSSTAINGVTLKTNTIHCFLDFFERHRSEEH